MRHHLKPLAGAGVFGLPLMAGLAFAQSIALPSIAKWWDEKMGYDKPAAQPAAENPPVMMS